MEEFLSKKSGFLKRSSKVILIAVAIALAAIMGTAQQGTSTVRGVITDPQGNLVAGASVTLKNTATGAVRTTTTNESGVYSFDFVQVGDYEIEVEAKGFKKGVLTAVHAQVSKPTPADIRLEVGDFSESVTITASPGEALLNREDATLGNVFLNQQVTQLPITGRSLVPLLSLQPAVTRGGSVAGARSDQSNVTLDGIDINESQTNAVGVATDNPAEDQLPTSNTVLRLNSEAIEEFRVTTTNANATQGRSSGAQVSLVTKSGSNVWHGALFEFYRSKGLAANDFFKNRAGVEKGQLIRHNFGGALGGPVIRDRAFFFYSFEARRQLSASSVVRTVPLPSLGQGMVRYNNPSGDITTLTTAQLNTIFPAVQMNPAAIAVLAQAAAKYPANDFTVGDSQANRLLNTAGFRFNAPTPVNLNSHVGRFDFNLTNRQQLFLRTNVIYDVTGLEPAFPDTPSPDVWSHPTGIAIGHTWTINERAVNNLRVGYTREAFTQQGDSAENQINFRFVFQPLRYVRTLSRITPVKNITDDFSWVHNNHTVQFGGNIRIINNERTSFGNAFDNAVANPSFYLGAGNNLSTPVNNFSPISGSRAGVQNAVSALIGRFSQYTANFTFAHDGSLLSPGSPTERNFATQEYDTYIQDVWKLRSNLTLTAGLRYSLSRPVYETNGFEMRSNIDLGEVFQRRLDAARQGKAFNDQITFDLSGPKNNAAPLYNWDKNNFQPRVSLAWSPRFESKLLRTIFGGPDNSVIRGGFAVTNDQYGEQLAVTFDLNNAVGFVSNFTTAANTFCTNNAACAAPLFTGFGQNVRALPKVIVPAGLTLPNLQPSDNSRRIEQSFDARLIAPINYTWNATFERQFAHGLVLTTSYIGRYANNLIATRDVMALNNLVDPKSGMDWYTAAGILEQFRVAGRSVASVQQIPYFANLFPADLGVQIWGDPTLTQTQAVYQLATDVFGNDWTDTQDVIDGVLDTNFFFHPQYGALAAISSIGRSRYHAGTITLRERLGSAFTADFNYTLSHSLDDASGLQSATAASGFGSTFILNPILQRQSYANSDFDFRHIINVNAIWQLPFGRGRKFLSGGGLTDVLVGGWQLSGIYRWNSGLPESSPFDDARWATNWNVQSNAIRIKPVESCPDRGGAVSPKLFGCDVTSIYRSFRNARPGEAGDRNVFRLPGYVTLDMGLGKEFRMPWGEDHKHTLQLRIEAFNVTNTQRMGVLSGTRTGFGISLDPFNGGTPPPDWSNFIGIQGQPREIQFGFRYNF